MKPLPMGPEETRALAAALRKIAFFADLSMRDLEAVLSLTSLCTYEGGSKIFKKGEVGDALYIIHRGEVNIVAPRFLLPSRPLARLGPGEFFGEMALLKQPYRTATAVAHGPVDLFVLLSTRFNQVLADNPAFARALEDVAARRAFESKARLAS